MKTIMWLAVLLIFIFGIGPVWANEYQQPPVPLEASLVEKCAPATEDARKDDDTVVAQITPGCRCTLADSSGQRCLRCEGSCASQGGGTCHIYSVTGFGGTCACGQR